MKTDNWLLTPGPVPLSESTQKLMAEPLWHHRTPEFEQVLSEALARLLGLFDCDGHVFALTSTGSGAMEAAVTNFLSPGDSVLCICSGKFGERWADMAETFGLKVNRMTIPWGESFDQKSFEEAYSGGNYKAVFTQACETSTGVFHPVEKMADWMNENGLLIVDGITAVGATPLSMKDSKIDVLVGGSQKAFALPTGMAFLGASKKALEEMENASCQRFYFDLRPELKANQKKQTRFSSPTHLFRALNENLKEMDEQHFRRTRELSEKTKKGFATLGFEQFPSRPSLSMTAIDWKEEFDGAEVRSKLEKEYGVTVMAGQDHLKNKILRVGHMGAIENSAMIVFFQSFVRVINELKPGRVTPAQLEETLELFR